MLSILEWKVGIFGVMYGMADAFLGVYCPIAAAETQVKLLREEGVEYIIAMTHQDWSDDNVFSKKVKGVDMIIKR